MFFIYQKSWATKRDHEIGVCEKIEDILDLANAKIYVNGYYGESIIRKLFSDSPLGIYKKEEWIHRLAAAASGRCMYVPPEHCWYVVTHNNNILHPGEIVAAWKKRRAKRNSQPQYNPGRKRHHCRYFRRPHTTQERRLSVAWISEEGEPAPRGSRSFCNLPNSWDDYTRSDYYNRNWKKFRKTQYK